MLPQEVLDALDAWMRDAETTEPRVPDAMQLATADASGRPSLRTVLLKSWDAQGLVFFTNYTSRKASQLDANPRAAVLLHWKGDARQFIAEGRVERLSAEDSDAYHDSRPRGSQLGAWASDQSSVLPGRATLEARLNEVEARFDGQPVPRPPHWGGYRIVPDRVELWQDQPDRLHVRRLFTEVDGAWTEQLLFP